MPKLIYALSIGDVTGLLLQSASLASVNGSLSHHLVDQHRGAFGHASCAATGAKPAPLATERNQVFMVTFRALHAQESVLQSVAFIVTGATPGDLELRAMGCAAWNERLISLRW